MWEYNEYFCNPDPYDMVDWLTSPKPVTGVEPYGNIPTDPPGTVDTDLGPQMGLAARVPSRRRQPRREG